jgi:hypothetical protein
VKGAPHERTPAREWTPLSAEAERSELELQLAEAQARADGGEVRRIEARIRLLAGL